MAVRTSGIPEGSQMKVLTEKRLEKVLAEAKEIKIDQYTRMVLMSDCHRGQGNAGDNFLRNQTLYFGALQYYYENGYTYIEIGDGDELWENRNLRTIIDVHSDAFWMLSRLYREGRLYMIFGNHDIIKRKESYVKKYFEEYYCENKKCSQPLFPGIHMEEGIILKFGEERILLVHGHQGSMLNDILWKLARFLVRYIWKPMELMGFQDPTGAGMPKRKKDAIERELTAFADKHNIMLIAGHTHRPIFSEPGQSRYFNDGSCVHPRCITGIEIADGMISLIKWAQAIREDQSLYVARQVLEGPERIARYFIAEETH